MKKSKTQVHSVEMLFMVLIPFIIVLIVSIGASLVASKKEGDFFLANRSIRWPLLLGTFVGTQVGGGFILGNTEASWKLGLFGSLYGVGLALGMLGLGLGYGARLRALGVETLPKLLEKRYESPLLKKATALLSIFSLGGILMCQAIGLKKFLCSMSFSSEWIYLLSWGVVVFYTTCGGLLAVVWTDVIQAVVMVVMLAITFSSALIPQWPVISTQMASMGYTFDGSVLASLIIPLCFIFVEQDMAQRCFAAKTPKDATKGCLATAVVLLILSAIPTLCGILGKAMNLSPDDGAIFMQVMKKVSNPFVFVMASSSVLLAIISTASAILLALSSNAAQDMMLSQKNGRFITLLLGAGALLGPYLGNDIIGWMVGSYEISVGALFIPIMYAVFTKRETLPKQAAWGSALLGTLGTIIAQQCSTSLMGVLIPFVLSAIGFGIGWKVGKKAQPAEICLS
jgi:SSS family solute:Na+ symporter